MMRAARLLQAGTPMRPMTTLKKVVHTPDRTGVQCTANTVVVEPALYVALHKGDLTFSLHPNLVKAASLDQVSNIKGLEGGIQLTILICGHVHAHT